MTGPQFQVGDRVRALTDVQHWTCGDEVAALENEECVLAGTMGTVHLGPDADGDLRVQWPHFDVYVRPSDLELVQP